MTKYTITVNGLICGYFRGTIDDCIKAIERELIPKAKRYKLTDKGKTSGIAITWHGLIIEAFPVLRRGER